MKKILLLVAAVATILCVMPDVQAQNDYFDGVKLTGLPTSMPTQSTSNLTSTGTALSKDIPVSVWLFIAGTNTGAGVTNTVTATFRLGYDGTATNYATTPTLTATAFANGTNQVVALTQFGTNDLRGANYIRLFTLANANTNTVSIGKIVVGQYRPGAAP